MRIGSQPSELAAVLNRIHKLLQNAPTAKRLDVRVAGAPAEAGTLTGDDLRLEQILLNLSAKRTCDNGGCK